MEHRHRHHSPSVLDILLSFTLLLILSTLPRMTPPTTILGAGLTGLTTAYRLSTLGVSPIVVLEKSGRIGGWVDSRKVKVQLPNGKEMKEQEQEQEVLLETGPRSIRPRGGVGAARMLRLISDLNIRSSLITIPHTHPSSLNRYILNPSSKELVRLPSGFKDLLKLGLKPRSWKIPQEGGDILDGFLRSIFHDLFTTTTLPSTTRDTTPASLVSSRLSPHMAKMLISSMIHGIYATDSRVLSVRSTFPTLWDSVAQRGSILRGLLFGTKPSLWGEKSKREEAAAWKELGVLDEERKDWSVYGFRGGIGTLVGALEKELVRRGVEIRRDEEVLGLKRVEGGVEIRTPTTRFLSSRIISTIPPSLLSPLLPLPHLSHNPSSTVGVINFIFPLPPAQIHPPGFGYLIPRSNEQDNPHGVLGVVFDSMGVKADEVEGVTKMTVMMGGPYWDTYRSTSPPPLSDLADLALTHLQTVFPSLPAPIRSLPSLHHACIPTYLPYHGTRLRELHEAIVGSEWKGVLSLAGCGFGGVGVNDCVGGGWAVAEGLKAGWVSGLERWEDWE